MITDQTNIETPLVTVIMPCRNEAKHIHKCLMSVVDQQYPKDKLEVLVIDGMSVDGTRKKAQTGARIKRVEKYIDEDIFMVTYGDGVGDIDLKKLIEFHKSHGKIGTITGVHPPSRFGELVSEDNSVVNFHEKPQVSSSMINGGFFVFSRKFFNYLIDKENCYLEGMPLEKLVSEGQLAVYKHEGFWQCVDTYRELELLNSIWKTKDPFWKVW